MRVLRRWQWGVCGLALTACASAPPDAGNAANNDPYEADQPPDPQFNGEIDRYFVIPTVALYFVLVPEGGRRSVHHFLENLTLPTTFVNDLCRAN